MITRTRTAFTLMEVALATLILVFSALVVLMLLPNALQVQKASRYKIVASLHAQNLMAHFYQSNLDTRGVQAFLPFKDDDLTDWRAIMWAGSSLGDEEEKGTYNLLKRNKLLSLAGEYDFERQIANAFNNTYPVPLSIARRLDSPNDEIKKILDAGGVIFYSDKLNSGINPNLASSSQVNSDLQQLVFGVVGAPQQNVLPYDPFNNVIVDLYPHSPQGYMRPTDRVYTGQNTYAVRVGHAHAQNNLGGRTDFTQEDGSTISGPFWVEHRYLEQTAGNRYPRQAIGWFGTRRYDQEDQQYMVDLVTRDSGNADQTHHETNNWEYYAYKHRDDASHRDHAWFDATHTWSSILADVGPSGATPKPYVRWPESHYTTLQAYRDLVQQHWLRIVHQIDPIGLETVVNGIGGGEAVMDWGWETRYRPVYDANNSTQRDAAGRVIMEPYDVWVGHGTGWHRVADATRPGGYRYYQDPEPSGNDRWVRVLRGFPHPATGLGYSLLGGTDITYDDAYAASATAMDNVRNSMPSLERRIKYRTQALILWAKAAYGKDIRRIEDPTRAYVEYKDASGTTVTPSVPSGVGRDYLKLSENPLENWQNLDGFLAGGDVIPSSGARATAKLHPTQVLALNYLAHAAMMVTGYRPPFVDRKQTLEAHDDDLLVPEGTDGATGAPYKDLPYRASRNSMLLDAETVADATDVDGSTAGFDPSTGWRLQPALVKMGAGVWGVQVLRDDGSFAFCEVDLDTGELQLTNDTGGFAAGTLHASYLAPTGHPNAGKVVDESGQPTSRPVVLDVDEHFYLRNPYHRDNFYIQDFTEGGYPAHEIQSTEELAQADPKIIQTWRHEDHAGNAYPVYDVSAGVLDMIGDGTHVPIGFRRPEGVKVHNPFPPPYADRGAFDAGGNPVYKVTWQLYPAWTDDDNDGVADRPVYQLLRKIGHDAADATTYGYDADLEHLDTQWARRAHEAMMRLVMFYTANNPYDSTVAKPVNRQTFIDRGIWQYDLFDSSGNAKHPENYSDVQLGKTVHYFINAPYDASARGDDFRFSMMWMNPRTLDNMLDYGEPAQWQHYYRYKGVATRTGTGGSMAWTIGDRAEPRRTGYGMRFGQPYPAGYNGVAGLFNRSTETGDLTGWQYDLHGAWRDMKYGLPESYVNYINRLHGNPTVDFDFGSGGFNSTPPAETAHPERFLATRAFEAEERTRQLVYWQVDWMEYKDFETAPSAPVDQSRINYQRNARLLKGYLTGEGPGQEQHNVMGWNPEGDLDGANGGGEANEIRMFNNPGRMVRFLTTQEGWKGWELDFGSSKYTGSVGDIIQMFPTDDSSRSYQAEVTAIYDSGGSFDFDWIIPYDNNGDGQIDDGEVLQPAGFYLNQLPLTDKVDMNLADMEGDRPNPGFNETGTITASADTYCRDAGYETTNYGGTTPMELKDNGEGDQYTRQVWFRFDLGSAPANWDKAELKVYFERADTGSHGVHFCSYDSWDEMTWTEAEAESLGYDPYRGDLGSPEATLSGAADNSFATVDITSMVQNEIAGDGILTVVLQAPDGGYNLVQSREGSNPPTLVFGEATQNGNWDPDNLDPNADLFCVNPWGQPNSVDGNVRVFKAWQVDPVHVRIFDDSPNHVPDDQIPSSKWDSVPRTCGGDKTIWFWSQRSEHMEGWANPWQNKMIGSNDSTHPTANEMNIPNYGGATAYAADSDFFSGNPEREFAFLDPERTATINWVDEKRLKTDYRMLDSGSGTPIILAGDHLMGQTGPVPDDGQQFDGWSESTPRLNAFMQVGMFGADRNRDGTLTIGDTPTSARMQALEVARFNFYDPVCWVRFGK